jgi:hypothetical protein
MQALESYQHILETHTLSRYSQDTEDWQPLDGAGWELLRHELLGRRSALLNLRDTASGERLYQFEYHGLDLDAPLPFETAEDRASAVSFWLPTEYLEEQGPDRVRALALELAAPLPFCSGHAGLAFNGDLDLVGVREVVHTLSLRYPGMDIPNLGWLAGNIGTRIRGPGWLTFLGQPVLGELGGASGLRSRLHSPGTTVQELDGGRAVVTLGPSPEAGDMEHGHTLPPWRELTGLLEPWLYFEQPRFNYEPPEEVRRWERRFLEE